MRIDLEGYGARYRAYARWLLVWVLASPRLVPGSPSYRAIVALRHDCPMAN
jgi:hypothetical protein